MKKYKVYNYRKTVIHECLKDIIIYNNVFILKSQKCMQANTNS